MPLTRIVRFLLVTALAVVAGAAAESPLLAQAYPAGGFGGGANPNAPANEVTEFKGKLNGVRGNILTVTREDDVECFVMFPDELNALEFVAPALPAYLRRGMPVRFTTTLGPTGMPLTPVDKIEIIAPVNMSLIANSQKMRFTPGVNSADRHAKPNQGPMTGKVYVIGSLMMLGPNGELAVQAGKVPVQTMVAPDAKVEIRANSLALAQPGDLVTVTGFYQPPDDTKVKAERIVVTTDRVFGETPPKPERKSRKKSKEDAVEPEPAPEATSSE
ncbi:hypothetical protein [Neorhodopirellula pilleata]|uniref:DUF5666 domain-containing protein n=1 Tax=Neorhodopirellula pilleata TaxID=2714738 RepID=A0A5C6A4Q3_9BACT|nr:hypothetical protein [Neorhodopirellula pilleata]TWT94350.1 hypothetical protein Pla100_39620 [Neorhodopirellula pilleata]